MEFRQFLLQKIKENEHLPAYKTRLANAAKCQLSYLLQVLKGRARLSLDQAYNLCLHWELNPTETDLHMAVACLDKSKSPELKAYYLKKIDEYRRQGL